MGIASHDATRRLLRRVWRCRSRFGLLDYAAMSEIPPETIETFVAACRRAGAFGLVRCSSGNMSRRVDDDRMLISASRSWMAELTADQVTVCRISDGTVLAGPRPSVETVFHAGILRACPEMSVVLHFQTPFATTLACGGEAEKIDYFVLPEIPYYIGPIGIVPYLAPGTPELAAAVVDVMAGHDLAMMANHGQVVVGTSFDDAIQKAVFFELACEIIVLGGPDVRPLSADAARRQRDAARGKAPRGV